MNLAVVGLHNATAVAQPGNAGLGVLQAVFIQKRLQRQAQVGPCRSPVGIQIRLGR